MPTDCNGHCADHDTTTATMNKHGGMWIVVLLILGGAIAGGWYLIDRIETQNQLNHGILLAEVVKIRESTQEVKVTFTAYIAKDSQLTQVMSGQLADHEKRLRALEAIK